MFTLPPPTNCGVAKALKVQEKAVVKPAMIPGADSGSVTFMTVTLPLSAPGIIAGFTTAFSWTFSAFATPQLVGGGKVNMISNLVYQLGFANFNFPFAASLSGAA